MGSISQLSSNYLQSILSAALQNTNSTTNATAKGVSITSIAQPTDNPQLSPFAQLMSTLQQLQQSNPAEYKQVTQQISTNLQTAAQTATTQGNTTLANQLNQLSTDFSNASTSGQLPNIQDLAQAMGGASGHHHHHGHGHAESSDSSSDSTSSSSTTTTTNSALSQLMSALQSMGTQSNSLNPMTIISNTLSSAGITSSNS